MNPDTPKTHARNAGGPAAEARRARTALAAYFFVTGALLPVWASRIPAVAAQTGVGPDALGMALLGLGVAATVTARAGGAVLDRVGPRLAVVPAAIAASAALLLPGTATGAAHLTAALVVLGIGQSFLNVCVNTQAAHLQKSQGRSMLSTFHAFVSIGGCAGALTGVASTRLGLDPLTTFQVAGLALAVLSLAAARPFLRGMPRTEGAGRERGVGGGPRFRPSTSPMVLLLGGLALAGVLAESAVQDWSALFAQQSVGASETMAATAFAAFTVAMACGRLMGDRLSLLLGRVLLVRAGAATALAGFVLALSVPFVSATLAGFSLVGLGLSCVVPQILSAAADLDSGRVGRNMGTVASIGYVGPLVGSPVIGAVASHGGVGAGLVLPAGLMAVLALGAGLLAHERTRVRA
ncbi:MFS transporter [Nocardiopsis sp. HNM0947]|uniref:MFS transporter n=1 Tax=Nocardiopsis coralli TaxID=2772213 RepID=A0ABR9P368_9ACTN|nr:MFS transporter [Nocardiopsis coralli]MBE2998301.1 MFS transporter [Nocardiopsis coralli]